MGYRFRPILGVRGFRVPNLEIITGQLGVTKISKALEEKLWTKTLKINHGNCCLHS